MSVLSERLSQLRTDGRAALVGYLPAGFPDVDGSIAAMQAMVDAGVDVIEVGLPYSDPVMDGPTIAEAAQRALAGGVRVDDVFTVVAAVADQVPTVVMTYWNPVEHSGVDSFAQRLADAGGAGLITPDLLPDEGKEWQEASTRHGLDRIYLVAPSSTDDRLAMTAAASSGFVYATSVMGVTGSRAATSSLAPTLVSRVRAVSELPVGVGLGVSDGEQAAEVAEFADLVIVGSALVRCLLDADDTSSGVAAVGALTASLAEGVRSARTAG
jgi:tryptophan synthase alpha chain